MLKYFKSIYKCPVRGKVIYIFLKISYILKNTLQFKNIMDGNVSEVFLKLQTLKTKCKYILRHIKIYILNIEISIYYRNQELSYLLTSINNS